MKTHTHFIPKIQFKLFTLFLFLIASTLYSQTEIGIAPGESQQIEREHSISILPISDVLITIRGEDSILVGAVLDSFRVIQGTLKIKTNYTLSVSNVSPIGQLNIEVVLTYSAEGALTQDVKEDFIINTAVQPSIVADFFADPLEGTLPLVVNFSNESFGEIIGYIWDFGDGTTSTEQSPQHTYETQGIYTVSLTVFNFNVQNKKTRESYINAGNVTSLKDERFSPDKTYLAQNYPNPFNPKTTIEYYLPKADLVEIKLYNITGRLVSTLVNDFQSSGLHGITFNADKLASGVYFYSLNTNDFSATRKLVINK